MAPFNLTLAVRAVAMTDVSAVEAKWSKAESDAKPVLLF